MKLLIEEYTIALNNQHGLSMDLYLERMKQYVRRKKLCKDDIKADILRKIEELNLCGVIFT
jgi:hypothetical protein